MYNTSVHRSKKLPTSNFSAVDSESFAVKNVSSKDLETLIVCISAICYNVTCTLLGLISHDTTKSDRPTAKIIVEFASAYRCSLFIVSIDCTFRGNCMK